MDEINFSVSNYPFFTKQINNMMDNFYSGLLYFPSRVQYLQNIIHTIHSLRSEKKYLFLTLNSSVGIQQIIGKNGFNFNEYFAAFRERHNLGDIIFRIYSLPNVDYISRKIQIKQIQDIINRNQLSDCINTYLPWRESFNCAYIIPFKENKPDVLSQIEKNYISIVNQMDKNEDWKQFLSALYPLLDIESSIIFHEIHDYDTSDIDGCGFKTDFSYQPARVKESIIQYLNLYKQSTSLTTIPENDIDDFFDIGIIVVLPNELQAIERQLDGNSMSEYKNYNGLILYRGKFRTTENCIYSIIVAKLPEAGNLSSAIATTILMKEFKVKCIFGAGIAGGLRNKVNLGDVIIAKWVIYFEKGKIDSDGTAQPDYRICNSNFVQIERHHDNHRFAKRLTIKPPDPNYKPSAFFDCGCLSGEKLIKDPVLLENSRVNIHRKIIAVENESAGIYITAGQIGEGTLVVSIKGISDFSDGRKDDLWHDYASDASAAYIFHFIDIGLKLHNTF